MTINDADLNPTMKVLHGRSGPSRDDIATERIDAEGRQRIAAFVHAALGWDYMQSSKNLTTGRLSRASVDRVKRGEVVSDTLLRALGKKLDLPRDFLLYIGYGDTGRIERLAEDADDDLRDLVRWTLEHLFHLDGPGSGPRARTA